jgi:hypothetical protein
MTTSRLDFLSMTRGQLAAAMRRGHAIEPHALDDGAYRGISLGLPRWAERLSWKTFQKTFHRDPSTGTLRGWNVRDEQRGLDAPSTALVRRGAPFTFGHYIVTELPPNAPRGIRRGLLIDYTPAGALVSRVRDPLVAVNEGRVDLLLGWSYLDLGLLRVPTPSYFLLEREGGIGYVPPDRS